MLTWRSTVGANALLARTTQVKIYEEETAHPGNTFQYLSRAGERPCTITIPIHIGMRANAMLTIDILNHTGMSASVINAHES
jgi:hypothetical protein